MNTKIQTKRARLGKMKHDKKTIRNISNFKVAKDKIYKEYEAINQKLQMFKDFLSEKSVHDLEKQLQPAKLRSANRLRLLMSAKQNCSVNNPKILS